jgi:hypothetical protein
MASDRLRAKIVRIKIEEGTPGLFVATSPDLTGLLVAEHSVDALEVAIPNAVKALYAACGERVIVTRAVDDGNAEGYEPWVAMPAEIAVKQAPAA